MSYTKIQNDCISVKKNPSSNSNLGDSLDTLAQLATDCECKLDFDCSTNLLDKSNLLKRARRKYFTNKILWKLVDAAKENPDSVLEKSYWNTYHCSRNLILSDDNSITGKYCNTRWCMVCNAIRTAKHINQYAPVVREWESPLFVTLTLETVDADKLKERIEVMQVIFRRIRKLYTRRNSKTPLDYSFKGIRKLECTHNRNTNKYHPHFHLICNCMQTANFLMDNWIRCATNEGIKVSRAAQDVRPADSKSLVELFKYMTKVITRKSGEKRVIDAKALDIIFNAMRNKRTIQPFGFKMPKSASDIKNMPTVGFVVSILTWSDEFADWLDQDGYMLTNYVPSGEFMKLLDA